MGLISQFDGAETWSGPELIALTCATRIITERKNMGKKFDIGETRIF